MDHSLRIGIAAVLLILVSVILTPVSVFGQQAPPAYFRFNGDIWDGNQFPQPNHFEWSTATGGGTISSNLIYPGFASANGSAGAASASLDVEAKLDFAHLSRHCNLVYGCGNSVAGSINAGLYAFVRGNVGTHFRATITRNSSILLNLSESHPSDGWAPANASGSTNGLSLGPIYNPPSSANDSANYSETLEGYSQASESWQTITYQGQTYTFAALVYPTANVSVYAEQEDDCTAIADARQPSSIKIEIIHDGQAQTPPTAKICGPAAISIGQNNQVTSCGTSGTGCGIVEYKWVITRPDGRTDTVISKDAQGNPSNTLNYNFDVNGAYSITLTVTDCDGLTATAQRAFTVASASVKFANTPPSSLLPSVRPRHNSSGGLYGLNLRVEPQSITVNVEPPGVYRLWIDARPDHSTAGHVESFHESPAPHGWLFDPADPRYLSPDGTLLFWDGYGPISACIDL
jgi:hypothetical protein